MNFGRFFSQAMRAFLVCGNALLAAGSVYSQVSPAEILNPKLKIIESNYLPQLQSMHRAIEQTKFPFPFALARYVTANSNSHAGSDSRGIEFVYFQNRVLLKISGIYSAAYNSDQLTANQRADRAFREVVLAILALIGQQLPADTTCDDIGFEFTYHTRGVSSNFDYEGREILAVVLSRSDALAYPGSAADQQQDILNRSRIYLNGKDFGLALGQTDPLNVEALSKSIPAEPPVNSVVAVVPNSIAQPGVLNSRSRPSSLRTPERVPLIDEPAPAAVASIRPAAPPMAPPGPADAERLQAQFKGQLDSLMKTDGAKFHLVEYAPPSFAIYHDQIVLQLTMRNQASFEKNLSSIYKRAAQSFDLFLAPLLKALLQKLPSDAGLDALDFSILNRIGSEKDSSEAVEFICPLRSLRSFADDEITTQDLISHSIVLVNGVRISLDLQLVE